MNEKLVLGVDIGGSHITTGLINLKEKTYLQGSEIRKHVDPHASAQDIINVWGNAIRETLIGLSGKPSKIGIAMPGPCDYDNGICLIEGFDKYETLYGLNIRQLLADKLCMDGNDILFRNDAEAFLEGELFCGAGRGYGRAIGITLGTGLGTAKSSDGITQDAALSRTVFKNGIIEDVISTRGLIATYHALTGNKVNNVKTLAAHYQSDAAVRETFKVFSNNVAWFLDIFIKDNQPEIIVIGGNIANAWDYFMPEVQSRLDGHIGTAKIAKAQLGETAALIGGACSWGNQFIQS